MTTEGTAGKGPKTKRKTKPDQQESRKKWGSAVIDEGFSIIPSVLLRAQQRVGVNATQLAILLHIIDFWWEEDRRPHPSKATLAERLGISPRQVQRHIAEMEKAGLIKREMRILPGKGRSSNFYDLSGLVAKLAAIAPDMALGKELAAASGRRGGVKAALEREAAEQ